MSDRKERLLDVFLRQGRGYIQGTQIIARSAETLTGDGWVLGRAQFNAITDKLVAITSDRPEGTQLGTAQFHCGDQTADLYFLETANPAPALDRPMPIAIARTGVEGADAAVYDYRDAATFEDALNVLVQSVKAEHEHQFAGATDIWFTGLRNIDLPTRPGTVPGDGHVEMSLIRNLGRDGRFQTMWNVGFGPDPAGGQIAGMTTFAYKSDEDSDAA